MKLETRFFDNPSDKEYQKCRLKIDAELNVQADVDKVIAALTTLKEALPAVEVAK